jgi:two-component system LytT family response regulator
VQQDGDMDVPLRVILGDRDALCRQTLKGLLHREHGVQVVAECGQAADILAALESLRPDILILDIQMPDGNILDMLRGISPESLPIVIVTSKFDQYALQAFEVKAFDYLLKPFDERRIHKAIEQARNDITKSRDGILAERLAEMIRHVRSVPESQLIVKSDGRILFLDVDEIDWVDAAANYVQIHAGRGTHVVRESVAHLAERLSASHFARIHRSIIVNLQKIKEVRACNSGEYLVLLKNGKELSCSRRYNSSIRALVGSR